MLLRICGIVLLAAAALPAQRGVGRPRGGPGRGEPRSARPGMGAANAVDRWNRMTPEQRERALEKLPPERQKQIRERMDRFNQLPKEEQDRLRERYERFRELPPEKQEELRREMRSLRDLPEPRRQAIAQELRELRALPGEERQTRMESEEFRSRYNAQEREILEGLARILPKDPK